MEDKCSDTRNSNRKKRSGILVKTYSFWRSNFLARLIFYLSFFSFILLMGWRLNISYLVTGSIAGLIIIIPRFLYIFYKEKDKIFSI